VEHLEGRAQRIDEPVAAGAAHFRAMLLEALARGDLRVGGRESVVDVRWRRRQHLAEKAFPDQLAPMNQGRLVPVSVDGHDAGLGEQSCALLWIEGNAVPAR